MYKRVIILQVRDNSYAIAGTKLCGMVRITGRDNSASVATYVTNVDSSSYGSWYIALCSGGKIYTHKLDTFNNCSCTLPIGNSMDIACVLVKCDSTAHIVAEGAIGTGRLELLSSTAVWDSIDSTPYERELAVTANFYDQGIQAMHNSVEDKYRLIEDYSNAFERYYASGQTENYYDNVKENILRLFVKFPPHYQLMKMYADSFFVRIDFRDSQQYFAMGVIQREGLVKYICYVLPAEGVVKEDKDFSYIESGGTGYYILYQDAFSGQITTILQ